MVPVRDHVDKEELVPPREVHHVRWQGNADVSSVCFAMSSRAKTVGPILGASDVPNEVSRA